MKRIVVRVILAFVGGVVVGGCIVFFWTRSILEWSDSVHVADSATWHLAALYSLRAGDTSNAISRLERGLDGEIVALGTMPHTEIVTGELHRVKIYRVFYPWRSDDKGIDTTVQHILSGAQAE
jgi:hypothetical protein